MTTSKAVGAKSYARTLEAFSGIAGKRVDFIMRKLAFDGLDGMFRRSPVDSGRFRGSWRVSLGQADLSTEPRPASGTKASQPQGTALSGDVLQSFDKIKSTVNKDSTIVISNNLPYAARLENGYSPQAPAGVLRPTFVEIESGLNRAIAASKVAEPDA